MIVKLNAMESCAKMLEKSMKKAARGLHQKEEEIHLEVFDQIKLDKMSIRQVERRVAKLKSRNPAGGFGDLSIS